MEDELDTYLRSVKDKHPMLDLFAKQTGVDLVAIETELKAGLRKADAEKKSATKKVPPKVAAKVVANARTPNMAFMQPLYCSAALQAVVGSSTASRAPKSSRSSGGT
jgi:hypothetical protein